MQQSIIVSEANEKEHLLELLSMRIKLEEHIANSVPNYALSVESNYLESLKSYFNDPNAKIYIASLPSTNEIIGMGISMLEYHDNPKIKIAGNIHYLWVEPEHRKNNIGKTIVARIIQFFKENGVKELFLDYNSGNVEAEKFWGRLGYTPGIIVARNSIENIEKKL